eukprot:TRINITY_DN24239_c0_g1_i1.p1 TRINITY_DN24239_c0_g1~~TRINITY_DN24239_c0_g1_i1.p1  ORF type:complete len:120 (-),score=26.55 TRINITY_DN24239_c0_g1_i1:61-420(-)
MHSAGCEADAVTRHLLTGEEPDSSSKLDDTCVRETVWGSTTNALKKLDFEQVQLYLRLVQTLKVSLSEEHTIEVLAETISAAQKMQPNRMVASAATDIARVLMPTTAVHFVGDLVSFSV